MQGYEYNTNSFCESSTGDIYFGGVNGFNKFHPKQMETAPMSPTPVLIDLRINEQPYTEAGYIGAIQQLDLSYKQNTLELTFVSPDHFNNRRNSYRYQLENFDTDWIDAGKRNFARYTKLPPGEYLSLIHISEPTRPY